MHLSIVSRHLPEPEGTSSGRILWALCQGLLQEGHQVEVCSWWLDEPKSPLPPWCVWRPLRAETVLKTRARSLVHPRWEVVRIEWEPAPGALVMADDPLSFPLIRGTHPSVLTQHYLTRLDRRAVGHFRPKDVQDVRSERWNAVHADIVLAYSERVAQALSVPARFVPMAYDPPEEALPVVEEPVAALVANWGWPPNQVAARDLLDAWPAVRRRVRGATLLLAGRNSELLRATSTDGVQLLGEVGDSDEVLGRAALLAFPCPASSGPKVKVLEALAVGLPVLTTDAGAEGLHVQEGRDIAQTATECFADDLAELLTDPERRADLGRNGRQAVLDHHAPGPAARSRVATLEEAVAAWTTHDRRRSPRPALPVRRGPA